MLPSQLGLNESLLSEEKRKIGDKIKRKEENENEMILTKAQKGSLRQVISEKLFEFCQRTFLLRSKQRNLPDE